VHPRTSAAGAVVQRGAAVRCSECMAPEPLRRVRAGRAPLLHVGELLRRRIRPPPRPILVRRLAGDRAAAETQATAAAAAVAA